jgi:hypothetical protein
MENDDGDSILVKVEDWNHEERDPTAPQELYDPLEAQYEDYEVVDYVIKAGTNTFDGFGDDISGNEPSWYSLTGVDETLSYSELIAEPVSLAASDEPDGDGGMLPGSDDEPGDTPPTGTLVGTLEDDVFVFSLSTEGDAPEDATILEFGTEGSDVLDLRDLLQGEEADGADLTSYLDVSSNGTDTVIKVSVDGGFKGNHGDHAKVDQTITLEGVDLVSGHDDMASVIQSMLDSGKLTIDQ